MHEEMPPGPVGHVPVLVFAAEGGRAAPVVRRDHGKGPRQRVSCRGIRRKKAISPRRGTPRAVPRAATTSVEPPFAVGG